MIRVVAMVFATIASFSLILPSPSWAKGYNNDEIIAIARDLGKKIEMPEEKNVTRPYPPDRLYRSPASVVLHTNTADTGLRSTVTSYQSCFTACFKL